MANVPPGNIIQPDPPSGRPLGSRNQENLQRAFKGSPLFDGGPIYGGSDEEVKKIFKELVQIGPLKNPDGSSTSGFLFSAPYNRDFVDAPNIPGVEKANDGEQLVSPYAPNIASAPAGALTQESKVAPKQGGGGAFQGDSLTNPADTSPQTARQKIGSLLRGTRIANED